MSQNGCYAHPHPLLNTTAHLLLEVEQEERPSASKRAMMPQQSGVEEPGGYTPSENFFRLTKDAWYPEPIDDPNLPKRLVTGFKSAKLVDVTKKQEHAVKGVEVDASRSFAFRQRRLRCCDSTPIPRESYLILHNVVSIS